MHYEYAREFLNARPVLKEGLKGIGRKQFVIRLLSTQSTKREQLSDGFPILSNHFPITPWLKLPRDERTRLLKLRETLLARQPDSELLAPETWELRNLENFAEMRQRQFEAWRAEAVRWMETDGYVAGIEVSPADILASLPVAALTPIHFYKYVGPVNYALIKLDWRKGKNALIHAFEKLLERRPSDFPGPAEPAKQKAKSFKSTPRVSGGRGGPADKLRQLAAMRLQRHYEKTDDLVDFLDDQKAYRLYKNAVTIERADQRARAVLGNMEVDGRFWAFSVPA